MSCDVGEVTEWLENVCSNHSIISPTSQLILQPFHCFIYITAHSPTLPLLYIHHSAHSPTLPLLYQHHSSFSNPSIASSASQLILQPSIALTMSQLILQHFHRFTYVTAHSPTLPSLYLRKELILQAFSHFTYVTAHSDSPSSPSLHLRHSSFSNPSLALPT